MSFKLCKTRLFFALVALFFLCQCTNTVTSSAPTTPAPLTLAAPSTKPHKKIESPYKLPVGDYLARAKNQQGLEQQNALLQAAGRSISEGQWRQASAILSQTRELTPEQNDEKWLLSAKIEGMRERFDKVLEQLSRIQNLSALSSYQKMQYHELLARAFAHQKQWVSAVKQRIALDKLLASSKEQNKNLRELWLAISNISPNELESLATQTETTPELRGWLELALISKKYQANGNGLLTAVEHWQKQFATHPANTILPSSLDGLTGKMLAKPKKIALLLPLTGPFSGPGLAVKDGFMAASESNKADISANIRAYDTNKEEVAVLYQQALTDGAEYVVGPLLKNQVAQLAALEHPVPTLLLNDAAITAQDNSYLFGLSPVNEAVQAAIKAKKQGYARALIIAPKSPWGSEVSAAFSKQWELGGGKVVGSYSYAANADLNTGMRDFLRITDSQHRQKQLKELLGYQLQSTISRRQDFDMIFLLAYPTKARQIMPLLRYYFAGDVPVYATSSVYSGTANALKDKDLDGLVFCDIPWVFSHQAGLRNWPEQFNSYNRLYALGMDSYALATQLNQLMVFSADAAGKSSGSLYLKRNKQVARVLEWGQFRDGLAHSLGENV